MALDEPGVGTIRGAVASQRTCSETLGRQEFILAYKSFEPVGPTCLPAA